MTSFQVLIFHSIQYFFIFCQCTLFESHLLISPMAESLTWLTTNNSPLTNVGLYSIGNLRVFDLRKPSRWQTEGWWVCLGVCSYWRDTWGLLQLLKLESWHIVHLRCWCHLKPIKTKNNCCQYKDTAGSLEHTFFLF